jgi:hypothetical protein
MPRRDYTPAIYGSLLVTTLIAVQARFEANIEFIAFSLITSVIVFWLTHTWAAIVNHRVRGPIGRQEIAQLGVDEAPMLLAAIVPTAVLSLVAFGVLSVDAAVNAALVVSLFQLLLWGIAVGRRAHTSWLLSIGVALVDFALGLVIVGLKLTALH